MLLKCSDREWIENTINGIAEWKKIWLNATSKFYFPISAFAKFVFSFLFPK